MNPDNKPQAEQLLDSLINCVLLLDNDLIIRYANQSAMQLFAQSARKLTGTPPYFIQLPFPRYRHIAGHTGRRPQLY